MYDLLDDKNDERLLDLTKNNTTYIKTGWRLHNVFVLTIRTDWCRHIQVADRGDLENNMGVNIDDMDRIPSIYFAIRHTNTTNLNLSLMKVSRFINRFTLLS